MLAAEPARVSALLELFPREIPSTLLMQKSASPAELAQQFALVAPSAKAKIFTISPYEKCEESPDVRAFLML